MCVFWGFNFKDMKKFALYADYFINLAVKNKSNKQWQNYINYMKQ